MNEKITQKLDQVIAKYCAGDNLPLIVGMITTPNELIYSGKCQNPKFQLDHAVNESSVFYLASMTKPITTAAALILNQNNKLNLDHPISEWIPEINNLRVLQPKEYGNTTHMQNNPITARDLITHSSGFGHPTWNESARHYYNPNDIADYHYPLLFNPGERWEYSNINMNLLANIIEIITGVSFREFVKKNIFEPIGMNSTDWQLSESMKSRLVSKFQRLEDGSLNISEGKNIPSNRIYGAGGLYGSGEDYLKFMRCIMNGGRLNGNEILLSSSIDLMTNSQYKARNLGILESTNQKVAKNISLIFDTDGDWTYGFLLNKTSLPTGRSSGSLTWFGSHNTHFWIDLKLGISGIFLTHLTPCGDEIATNAYREFESEFYGNIIH